MINHINLIKYESVHNMEIIQIKQIYIIIGYSALPKCEQTFKIKHQTSKENFTIINWNYLHLWKD